MNDVIQAFQEQARYCSQLGSLFTARLCASFVERLDHSTATGRLLLQWPGDPGPKADSVPLRMMGALHALARDGRHAELAACYPPHPIPDVDTVWSAIAPLLDAEQSHFEEYLRHAPQTNEVGRSTVLMAGLLEVASCTKTPLRLFEIGASAGLNLILDRYRYRFGDAEWGNPSARLCLAPAWSGDAPPVNVDINVVDRRGVDLNPLNLSDASERARLLSYVWADQTERLKRIEAAIDTALESPASVDRMDAAEWLETRLHLQGDEGVTRVLMHSIVWSYLSEATRKRIEEHMHECARHASLKRPLAWVRFEFTDDASTVSLRVSLWPHGETKDLAVGHPHGSSLKYLAHVTCH